MQYIPLLNIINHLDIHRGDNIFVSSDVTSLCFSCIKNREKFNLDKFIDSIINIIGPDGTLIFPTYNWGFCSGKLFDYYITPSETGSLSNLALKRKDFRRTKHPIYSFAVWGKDQDFLCNMSNKSSFGADSPFGYFDNHGVKNLMIGVSLPNCFTYVHYIQEISNVRDCRYLKTFCGEYIDENSEKTVRSYQMLVKDLDLNVEDALSGIEEELLKLKIANLNTINGVDFTLLDMHASSSIIMNDVVNNRSRKLCTFIGQ